MPLAPLLALAISAAHAQPQPAPALPTTRVLNCTTSGCHAKQQNYPFLHGPNAVQACDACHEYVDPAKHTFQMKRPGRNLCDFCHIDKTGTEGTFVHDPVAKGECATCHDPHGGTTRKLLKNDSIVQLCTQCHKTVNSAAHIHKPAQEDCRLCHKPHTADHEKLLILDRRALCLKCHEDVGRSIDAASFHHEPVNGDCLQCHTAHSTDQVKALKMPAVELCASCHKETYDKAMAAKHKHAAVSDTRACLNCHLPHGADHSKLLAKDPTSSCLACHDKPIKLDDPKARPIAAMKELALDTFHKHAPVEKGDCAACHTVHGGEQTDLLVAPYSTAFYQQFTDDAYALCFKCHDKQLALAPTTQTATSFRNADQNLHYLHVVKSGPQGRSCRACHTTHLARNPKQVGEKVPFGEWEIPINFQVTPTGGSCAPGCHKPAKYDHTAAPAESK